MKTFFNVLYRRILYKIPFKWLLVLLVVVALGVASFSSSNYLGKITRSGISVPANSVDDVYYDYAYCIYKGSASTNVVWYYSGNSAIQYNIGINTAPDCFSSGTAIKLFNAGSSNASLFSYDLSAIFSGDGMDSITCQTEYNLIPISSVDEEYCTTNNLCSSGGTPSDCPNVGVSNVFINDIFHPGAFNIVMNIPEEIDRDYAYTNSGNNLNIDVVGYNVDYEKMQEIIDLQNYKPTDEDFSSLVGMLAPYTKIIIFFVFLFIVWAWIKKPFKSKKL